MIREESIHLPFRYAAGEAGSRFLIALRDDRRILASRCPECARTFCPVRGFCPQCGGDDLTDVEVGPAGTIVAWTNEAGTGAYALIRLDGADTALLHRLLGDPHAASVGMRVRARFALEGTASILDLEGFEAAEDEPA